MRLAIIPARGGSKRIPRKNIIDFCGKPMISYALESARQSGLFDCIHVSTDCLEIAEVVKDLGYEIEFLRDESLADDFTGLIPVMRWVLEQYEKRGVYYQDICCIMPNAPLLQPKDLQNAYDIFQRNEGIHPLLVFAQYPVPIEWAFQKNENDLMQAYDPEKLKIRSQDIRSAYYECGPFTIWKRPHLESDNPLENDILSYIMPRERAVDIDTQEDLIFAEKLYKLT